MNRPTLIFDGDCGFCTWAINHTKRWLKPDCDIIHWQGANLDALGVTPNECMTSIQFVRADGTHVSEGRAVAEVLLISRLPFPALGAAVKSPIAISLANAAYRVVAKNRYRLPGSTPACQLPSATTTAATQ